MLGISLPSINTLQTTINHQLIFISGYVDSSLIYQYMEATGHQKTFQNL